MNCALCLKEKKLTDSHIIPDLVTRWIKDTSATGYLRDTENINVRNQKGMWKTLLCGDCEDLFEKWEDKFAGGYFCLSLKILMVIKSLVMKSG